MNSGTMSLIAGVILLILIKILFKSRGDSDQDKEVCGVNHEELFKEDLDFDPSWSVLSSNTHHSEED